MRGSPDPQLAMLSSLSTEDLIPADHPIRRIPVVVDAVLAGMNDTFEAMYAAGGRRSVPPETLLKSTGLMATYTIRSERAFCEELNDNLLFKWLLDMRIDQPAFDATTFTKNRPRLLEAEVADVLRRCRGPGRAAPLRLLGPLLRRWHPPGGVGVAQELQAQRQPAQRAAGR